MKISVRSNNNFCVFISLLLAFIFFCSPTYGQEHILDNKIHHLRNSDEIEWESFSKKDVKKALVIHFQSQPNTSEKALYLRQFNVKQPWHILVNKNKIGLLFVDENDIYSYYKIPEGLLIQGENILEIESENTIPDDILISEIKLNDQSVNKVLSEAFLDIEVVDKKSKKSLPCRVTIARNGVLQTIIAQSKEQLAVRPGFIYTNKGKVSFGLPAGRYTIYAGRGFEYGVDSVRLTVKPGDKIYKRLAIQKEVPLDGWASSDTHIHSLTYSGHGDATIEERALTIAGEGIELPIITEHNVAIDIMPVAKAEGVDSFFTPVTGTELTTNVGHFNLFPVIPGKLPVDYRINNWDSFYHSIPNDLVIILNHARDLHSGFRPFDPKRHIAIAGLEKDNWKFPANAMEVINSGSLQTDVLQLYHDWFGMLNHGLFLTPVGSSDSHDVSRYLIGQARTYIKVADNDPGHINIRDAVNSFKKGKVIVSCGLLTEIKVNNKYGPGEVVPYAKQFIVSVQVSGPAWTQADHVTLYANGYKIREANISSKNKAGIKWQHLWNLPALKHDVYLVAVATGPYHYLPFWPIVNPYQHISPVWKPGVIGSTGVVWIDADNNKLPTSANEYAKELVEITKKDINKLVKLLASYDQAVAVQVAAELYKEGIDLNSKNITKALQVASLPARSGFNQFIQELELSNK